MISQLRILNYQEQPSTQLYAGSWESWPAAAQRQFLAELQRTNLAKKAEEEKRAKERKAFAGYLFEPERYIREKLGWFPWAGSSGEFPGQVEVIQAYRLSLLQQHEQLDFEAGKIQEHELRYWQPGQTIQNRIRIEAGHGVGKTKLVSGLFSHFFDCFNDSIIYTFAPTWGQIKHLLWKEIKSDRRAGKLPGRILDSCEIKTADERHFAIGKATGNQQTEKVQGQHAPHLMFALDEAEGIADFVWDAIDSMASGGVSVVLMIGNPRSRSSKFYKQRTRSSTANFRLSSLNHPNVLADRDIIPGAVRRRYIIDMLEDHCEKVAVHDPDKYTFELPWSPGAIYKADDEFLFRVLGVPALNQADNVFFPVGRYESAVKRNTPGHGERTIARIGVDVARYGTDAGTIYANHAGTVWRHAKIYQQDNSAYAGKILELAEELHRLGVTDLQIRIDAGGGFGGGVADIIKHDQRFKRMFFTNYQVIEVNFGGKPQDDKAYYNLVTQMYATAGEAIKNLWIQTPSQELEADLTERPFDWAQTHGIAVRRLTDKESFKDKQGRSPDDGDGFCLAAAPDYIFVNFKRVIVG